MTEKQKRAILITVMVVSTLPVFLIISPPDVLTLKATSLYFSELIGYLGILLLVWMYILGARSVFTLWFRDLAPHLRLHKWLGKYGVIMILIHPILISYYYGETFLLYAITPNISTDFEQHVTLGRIAAWLIMTIWVTSALFRKRLGYRPWKYIHFLVYLILPFALLHIPTVGTQFFSSTAVRAYYFTILTVLVVFTLLRLRGLLNLNRHSYTIQSHTEIADSAYQLELKTNTNNILDTVPGQYVYIKHGLVSEDHPFSVVMADKDNGTLTLCYRATGRFTHYLSTLQKDTKVSLNGPYGRFTHEIDESPDQPVIFIVGGIGITPFVQRILKNSSQEQWLFYANRTHKSAVYEKQLAKKLGKRYVGIYSQEKVMSPDEELGYFTKDILTKHLDDPKQYTFYLCGPEQMIKKVKPVLASLGVSNDRIFTEVFEF